MNTPKGKSADAALHRRDFLKGSAALAGAAMIGPGLTACGDDASTTLKPLRGDGTDPLHYIDNIVIVQMENRSFDHYFGSLSLDEGRTDVRGLTADLTNPMADGERHVPIEWLSEDYIISPDPGHSYSRCVAQWNNGANDGFIRDWEEVMTAAVNGGSLDPDEYEKRLGWAMGYYKRQQLPTFYTLADNFTVADHWFSSMLGPTWPNRKYSHGATSDGTRVNQSMLETETPYRRLREQGGTVEVYASIPLFHFGLVIKDLVASRAKTIVNFLRDAENGTLPNVSIVEPDFALNDDHPPQDVRLGQSFVASIYEALRKSPQWERTLMVVFYDEHGGFYDSAAPPKVEGEALAAQDFDQLGFRVPALLVGPLVKRGHVFSGVVDHSSVPALISNTFQLGHVNERSRLAGDLSKALDIELIEHAKRVDPPALPKLIVPHSKIRYALAQPFGQPELRDFARSKYGIELPTYAQQLQNAEDTYIQLERMGVVRITDN